MILVLMKLKNIIYIDVMFLNKFITPQATILRKFRTGLNKSNYRLVKKYERLNFYLNFLIDNLVTI